MLKSVLNRRAFAGWAVVLVASMWWASGSLHGQQPAGGAEAPAKKTPAAPKGRLPNYFGDVVDQSQREKIYNIQQLYAVQIEKIESQLKDLLAKRDAEVEAVLSTEQKARVQTLRDMADAKRKAAAEAAKAKATAANSEAPKTPAPAPKK